MRVERDVTGKANFVMWHARASGKLMVSYFSKLGAQSPWLWSDGEENIYTPKYHEVTCLLEKALKLFPVMKNPRMPCSLGTLPSSSPGETLYLCLDNLTRPLWIRLQLGHSSRYVRRNIKEMGVAWNEQSKYFILIFMLSKNTNSSRWLKGYSYLSTIYFTYWSIIDLQY